MVPYDVFVIRKLVLNFLNQGKFFINFAIRISFDF